MIRRAASLLLPLLLLAAGCTATDVSGDAASSRAPSPFVDCAGLTAAPASTPSARATPAGTARPSDAARADALPKIELSCFTGGRGVPLGTIRGPIVINLWASWCPPCRAELPAFERLHQRTAGKLHVVGVDTKDTRAAAQSTGEDLGLTFPTLFDPDERLRLALGRNGLPMTLFVDADGRVRHVYQSTPLDDAALGALVERHLGVGATA
ncbi:TlpA disulfide reductase family protein [Micromonospora sp. NPDC049679]|uniref:TlpA family protein disulfide reductase n=1 Tax=Micromonospora sp. NPDC049679 TaxID=3155920 RepID=UPI0033DBA08B